MGDPGITDFSTLAVCVTVYFIFKLWVNKDKPNDE